MATAGPRGQTIAAKVQMISFSARKLQHVPSPKHNADGACACMRAKADGRCRTTRTQAGATALGFIADDSVAFSLKIGGSRCFFNDTRLSPFCILTFPPPYFDGKARRCRHPSTPSLTQPRQYEVLATFFVGNDATVVSVSAKKKNHSDTEEVCRVLGYNETPIYS